MRLDHAMREIHIGGQEHEFLAIQILGRNSPESGIGEYFENNWLECVVSVRAGGFRGDIRSVFLTEDFVRLRDGLRELVDWKEISVDFSTLEGWLALHFSMDEKGGIVLHGDLVDRPLDGNRLRFDLAFDQSYLPPVIADLESAIEAYPVIGTCEPPQ